MGIFTIELDRLPTGGSLVLPLPHQRVSALVTVHSPLGTRVQVRQGTVVSWDPSTITVDNPGRTRQWTFPLSNFHAWRPGWETNAVR